MTALRIDNAVLDVAEVRWKKVAMIVVRAAEKLGPELPDGDAGYHMVTERIAALVDAGRLAAQGDVSRWRHSEVRLP